MRRLMWLCLLLGLGACEDPYDNPGPQCSVGVKADAVVVRADTAELPEWAKRFWVCSGGEIEIDIEGAEVWVDPGGKATMHAQANAWVQDDGTVVLNGDGSSVQQERDANVTINASDVHHSTCSILDFDLRFRDTDNPDDVC